MNQFKQEKKNRDSRLSVIISFYFLNIIPTRGVSLHIIDKYPTKCYQLCLQRPCDNVAVLVSNTIFDVNKKTQHILMKFSSVNIHTTSVFFSFYNKL